MDIRGWDNESSRSVANVTWFSGSTNVYRLGQKGNCDIKFVEPTSGGFYYPEHLPILGKMFAMFIMKVNSFSLTLGQSVEQPVVQPQRIGPPPFGVGDKVQVNVSVEQLKLMQQGHGGWNPRMSEVGLTEFVIKIFLLIDKLLLDLPESSVQTKLSGRHNN